MNENKNEDDGAENKFDLRCQEARALGKLDYAGARSCLKRCRDDQLTPAETAMVMSIIAAITDLDLAVLRALNKEVLRDHPKHGSLNDVEQVSKAMTCELEDLYGPIVFTEGSLWAYCASSEHHSSGIWIRLHREKLERILLQTFSVEVTARVANRREIVDRIYTTNRDDDVFSKAVTGIAFSNGFLKYDAQTNAVVLMPHAPEQYARNKIDVNFESTASSRNFRRKLKRTFGDDEVKLIAFLEFLACAMFRERPSQDMVRTCLTLFGSQRTGKSTLLEFAKLFFLDEQVASLSPELLGKPENNVHLAGKTLNVVAELHARKMLRGDVLKQALSHEPLSGRLLYQNLFNFVPNCMHIWACNELPRIDETHPSLMRRFIVLGMGTTLTDAEAADDFAHVVEAEAEGIVALLVESFCDVMARGRFILPHDSDRLVTIMQFGNDIAPNFMRFRLEAKPGARLTTETLKLELMAFAADLGWDPDDTVHDGVFKRLSGLMRAAFGATRRASNGRPFYEGVALIDKGQRGAGDTGAGPANDGGPDEVDLDDL